MKTKIKEYLEKLGIKGQVRNHSSEDLWVIESTTNHLHGPPIAHILGPGRKSSKNIDADGFKRVNGKKIDNHSSWWKILDFSTADIFNHAKGVEVSVLYKIAVPEDHFGKVKYDKSKSWGENINYVINVKKDSKGKIVEYQLSENGWIKKQEAIKIALNGEVDNAVIVGRNSLNPYLRSYPGQPNFGSMG